MIENIPTSEDFKEQGIWFLNLAWDAVFDLISDFSEFVEYSISALDHDYKECLEYCDSDTDPKFVEFCKEHNFPLDLTIAQLSSNPHIPIMEAERGDGHY